ncbi:MAG: insulinase family protein [Bacteroidales bacterium]|nr:insulinase family protein [Bacteroidales bacterium]
MNSNYKLIEKRHVDDVEGDAYLLEHIKSGAKVLKVANNDSNKTFCITFRTEPDDNSGIPHILEHSVLNGSKKYPVKSPFDQLLKGSLSTFLNAMTGEEMTMFPAASVSHQDYFNLMDVYLDAVFNPLIYSDKRILQQEGWRIEAKDVNEPFRYTGVVYNEMKGNYSDPMCEAFRVINSNLFPDNGYGRDSGGYPPEIPTLTQQHFEDYHRRHYCPENAYIFLYGDADFEKELKVLDEGYLSKYEKVGYDYTIPRQKPFAQMKRVASFYPAGEDSDPDGSTYNTLSFVTCPLVAPYEASALNLIMEVLVNRESGAIKNALINSGICTSIEFNMTHTEQCVVTVMGLDCKRDTRDKFFEVIDGVLRDTLANGIDKDGVEAMLNRIEFMLCEGNDAQQGLKFNYLVVNSWLLGENPIDQLELQKNFAEFKQRIANGLLEDVLKKYLIGNPHAVLASFEPKQGLEAEAEAAIQKGLDDYKATLSKAQVEEIVADAKALDEYQNTPNTPEELKCIPSLKLSDLDPKAEDFPIVKDEIDGTEVLRYHYNTNGIIYTRFIFDMNALPVSLAQYGSLLTDVIGLLPTKNYTFGELDTAIRTYTGSCGLYYDYYMRKEGLQRLPFAEYKFQGRALTRNFAKMTDLMIEMCLNTILDDKDRLRDVIMRKYAELSMELNYDAFQFARDKMLAQYNCANYISEMLGGISYYQFVKDLSEHFDEKADEIVSNLQKAHSMMVSRDNLKCYVYCRHDDYAVFVQNARRFIAAMPVAKTVHHDWNIVLKPCNEAIITPSKVQYVFKSCDLLDANYKWSGAYYVLNKIMSSDYLQTNVRVRGGAYGCWGGITPDGIVSMASYRDPNLANTLDIYDRTAEYLQKFCEDEEAMTKYIIGTIATKDSPVATSNRGNTALQRYRQGFTFEEIQQDRYDVLATTAEQIRQFAPMLARLRDTGTVCVLGGDEMIGKSKDLFNNIIRL